MVPVDIERLPTSFAKLRGEGCIPSALRQTYRHAPEGVRFRARDREDAAGLHQLFSEPAFTASALTRPGFPTPAALQSWLDGLTGRERFEIVAEDGSEGIVGFIGLYPQGDFMAHTGTLMLGVREAAQGRGIGGYLLHLSLLTAWLMAGLSKVQLTVYTENAPAIRLYEKAGFEIEGRLRRFVRRDGAYVDAFAMALLLD